MNKRPLLLGLFLFAGIVLMAAPAQPIDWIDRIVADHASVATGLTTVGPSDRPNLNDWADRMIAAGVAAPQPVDWIDRVLADRGRDLELPSFAQPGGVKAAIAGADRTRD